MDWEIREIEKYYLSKKDPKFLYKNIDHMTPQELRDIVSKVILFFLLIFSLKKNLSRKRRQKNSYWKK